MYVRPRPFYLHYRRKMFSTNEVTAIKSCFYAFISTVLVILFAQGLEGAIVCPPVEDYAPCNCTEFVDSGTINLNCNRQNLTDAQVDRILDSFLLNATISPVSQLFFILMIRWRQKMLW